VLIDSNVEASDELTGLIRRGMELALIDSASDPLAQIESLLHGRTNVRALHIVSHGQSGQLNLGGQTIDSESLVRNAEMLRSWRAAFTPEADILLYGCETAAGEEEVRFLQTLSRLTGTDVAGSIDRTGIAQRGGDWVLEASVGQIDCE